MKISELKALLECRKRAMLLCSNVLNPTPEQEWAGGIKKRLAGWLQSPQSEFRCKMEEYLNTLNEDWYGNHVQFSAKKEEYRQQLSRLAAFFYEKGYMVMSTQPWNYEVRTPFGLVKDSTDAVFKARDGTVHYVSFDVTHSPVYSSKARNRANLPQYSPELLLPAMALRAEGRDPHIDVWYLKGKEDEKGYFPPFEVRQNSSMISYCYREIRDIENRIGELRQKDEGDCEKCQLKSICKGYAELIPCGSKHILAGKECMLSPDQAKVVSHFTGPLAVIASPGSGKTFTLVKRMEALVNEHGVNPSNILFLTFARKACYEIIERVSAALGLDEKSPRMPMIQTFNGFAYQVLRDNWKILGKKYRLASDCKRREILETVLNSVPPVKGCDYGRMEGPFGLVARADEWIEYLRRNGVDAFAKRYPRVDIEGVKKVAASLELFMKDAGYIRYDDQLGLLIRLFTKHPDIAEKYSKMYRYVMVDEYQDVSDAQQMILELLARHGNLVTVGDDDQAVYSFRGGTNQHMLRFSKQHQSCVLRENYRSNSGIVSLSNTIISHNRDRIDKTMVSHIRGEFSPVLLQTPGQDELLRYVKSLTAAYGGKKVAILARTNSELAKVEPILSAGGITCSGGKRFLVSDRNFTIMRDAISVHFNGPSSDPAAFARLYGEYVGQEYAEAEYGETYYSSLVRNGLMIPVEDTVDAAEKCRHEPDSAVKDFATRIFRTHIALEYIYEATDALQRIFELWCKMDDVNSVLFLRTFIEMMQEAGIEKTADILPYMDMLVRYGDTTRVEYDYSDETVNLLTAHDAKGKEFEGVIVLNADSFSRGYENEEDTRVLYVAVTRAKSTLILTTEGGLYEQDFIQQLGPTVSVRNC